jgi:hypothetical protein
MTAATQPGLDKVVMWDQHAACVVGSSGCMHAGELTNIKCRF